MRKLLVLLSVVLLFALCQSQDPVKTKKEKPHFCPFGYKKVNGTKICRTLDEFLRNPKNATNCTKNKELRCRKFDNKTLCFCIPKFDVLRPHRNITRCKPGETLRCKFDRKTLKRECKCQSMVPRKYNTSELVCEEGTVPKCKGKRCVCAKVRDHERRPHLEPSTRPENFA